MKNIYLLYHGLIRKKDWQVTRLKKLKSQYYPKPNDLIVNIVKQQLINVEKFLKNLQLAAKN